MNAFAILSALVNKIHVSLKAMSLGEHPGRDLRSYGVGYDFFAKLRKKGQLHDTVSQQEMVGTKNDLRFR
jgi:hypothetical protein